jgi:multidrug efflux pump subunit AcrA (membrane-fusion protein)
VGGVAPPSVGIPRFSYEDDRMVRFPSSRRSPLFLALLIGLAVGCGRPAAPPEETAPPATVKWQGLSENSLEEWTELVGATTPLPDHVARIGAPVEGRVLSVLQAAGGPRVREGDVVEAGDVLVRLDPQIAQANRDKMLAALKVAEEEQVQSQAAVKLATIEVERLRELKKRDEQRPPSAGSVPLVNIFELRKADAMLDDAQSRERSSQRKIDQAKKDLAAVEEQLKLFTIAAPRKGRLSRLLVAQGQPLSIGAPIAEVVDIDDQIDVLCFVPPSMVGRLKVGFNLTSDSLEALRARVPEAVLAKLQALKDKKGQESNGGAPLTREQFLKDLATALTREELRKYEDLVLNHAGQPALTGPAVKEPNAAAEVEAAGEIVYIAEQAEPETGNYAVKVRFSNKDAHLRANRVLRIRVLTRTRNALSLPESAVQEDEQRPTVVIVTDRKKVKNGEGGEDEVGVARRMQVELGLRDRGNRLVEIVNLVDPEKDPAKRWHGEIKDALFVVEGGQGLQTGDAVKLEVEGE